MLQHANFCEARGPDVSDISIALLYLSYVAWLVNMSTSALGHHKLYYM